MDMRLSFMRELPVEQAETTDPTTWISAMPRAVRKTMRLNPSRQRNVNTHDGVDDYMAAMDCRVDTYHTQNLEFLDRGFDFDEFDDIDDEHEGLTITEPMGAAETFDFLTGYDTL